MKVKFTLSIGFPTAEHEETFEYNDDVTDKMLRDDWEDWSNNYIEGGWERIEE